MPELPEVETIRRILEPQLAGRSIAEVTIENPQVIAHPEAELFAQRLTGQTVKSMSRRGKFLTLHFESGSRLCVHLRMTGQLLVMPRAEPVEKHTHFIAELSDESQLRYIDVRRFGRFWYFENGEADTLTGQDKLGRRKKAIKEMLHDQTVVAGIGNIYSDEILSAAGLNPEEKCAALTDVDWVRLTRKIKEVLRWGIETNDMTPQEYLAGRGKEYRNMPNLRVYGREGQPCTACQTPLVRVVVGGRSSCYCPRCQAKKAIYI